MRTGKKRLRKNKNIAVISYINFQFTSSSFTALNKKGCTNKNSCLVMTSIHFSSQINLV